jgi:hypothetical protein
MATYKGVPKLKTLNYIKDSYGGKNENGGRKCIFRQSKEYKRRGSDPSVAGITINTVEWGVGLDNQPVPCYDPPTSPDHDLVLDKAA